MYSYDAPVHGVQQGNVSDGQETVVELNQLRQQLEQQRHKSMPRPQRHRVTCHAHRDRLLTFSEATHLSMRTGDSREKMSWTNCVGREDCRSSTT